MAMNMLITIQVLVFQGSGTPDKPSGVYHPKKAQ